MGKAKAKLYFIPQDFKPLVLKIVQGLLPFVLRFRTRPWLIGRITKIEAKNVGTLVKLYHQFQAGKIRFLMAFRHSEVEDPLCMLYLMSRIIPKTAKTMGIYLQSPIHTHFIYDRGMTIWAGNWLGWLFSRSGGIPIHRGKPLDRIALKNARDLFARGKFPLTVAPEGATNGHGEKVSPLEPGTAQLGFWCVEDLVKTNCNQEVLIVPIGIRYYYLKPPWQQLDHLFSQLEIDSGLSPQPLQSEQYENVTAFLYPRLLRLGTHLLQEFEDFYKRFYNQEISLIESPELTINQKLAQRLPLLLDMALKVAEEYFNLPSRGTIIDRCRRLEEVGWNRIYREDITDMNKISPLQRGLADWIAEEAELRLKHMRLVESFVAVTGSYVQEKPSPERFAETALILYDLIARIKGKKIPRRPCLGKRKVIITIGDTLSVSKSYPNYKTNRRAAKQAIHDLTQDLQIALEKLANCD